jgi:hypothetical protein
MEVSGQLHAPTALPPGKQPLVPLDRRLGGAHLYSVCRLMFYAGDIYVQFLILPQNLCLKLGIFRIFVLVRGLQCVPMAFREKLFDVEFYY